MVKYRTPNAQFKVRVLVGPHYQNILFKYQFMNITIEEVNKHFKTLSPFQAKKVTESYIGQKIKWKLHFFDLTSYKQLNNESVYLVHTSEDNPYFSIFFKVDINKFPQFMSMKRKEIFEVIAKIESIQERQIDLFDIEDILFDSEIKENLSIKNIDNHERLSNFNVVNNIHNSQVNLNTKGVNSMNNNHNLSDKSVFTMNNPIIYTIVILVIALVSFYLFGIR